jgi:hypothetical protein
MQGGATGTGVVTLLAPVTNTNRTINLPDSNGTIVTSATAGVPINGPAFSAYSDTNQTISSSTHTKITFGVEEFDTNSNFASSRFTPTVAGYYQVSGAMNFGESVAATRGIITIYKNGVAAKRGTDIAATGHVVTCSALIYLNGSTDYVELFAYITATTATVASGAVLTFFQAALIRSST